MPRGATFALFLALVCHAAGQEYAGSQACAPCHHGIYESYRATPMALSGAPPGAGLVRETFSKASFDGNSGWRYRVSDGPGGYALEFDRAAGGPHGVKRLAYAIGSGAKEVAVFKIGEKGQLTELAEGQSPLKLSTGQNVTGLVAD